jgi:hypothetical protein
MPSHLLSRVYLNGPSPAFNVKTESPGFAFSATSNVYTAFPKSGVASAIDWIIKQIYYSQLIVIEENKMKMNK